MPIYYLGNLIFFFFVFVGLITLGADLVFFVGNKSTDLALHDGRLNAGGLLAVSHLVSLGFQ